MKIKVQSLGVEGVAKMFLKKGAEAFENADKITETYTRKMANESAKMAPVKTSDLRNSILASPRRAGRKKDGVWQYGSRLPYARRQEYEHLTHKGFIRKSVWSNREPYREALRKEFERK